MKKNLGLVILLMMCFSVFAKSEKKQQPKKKQETINFVDAYGSEIRAKVIEISSNDFFGKDFSIQKNIVYKISGVELTVGVRPGPMQLKRFYMFGKPCDNRSLSKILTETDISMIERAEKFVELKTNYIVYAQIHSTPPSPDNINIVKIENIPTEKQLAEKTEFLEKDRENLKLKAKEDGGYDNLPWGTTTKEFLGFNSNVKREKDEGSLVVYSKEGAREKSKMFYKFLDDELVAGMTKFSNIDKETGEAIIYRLKELYGNQTNDKTTKEHRVETDSDFGIRVSYTEHHLKLFWEKASTFKITLDACVLVGDSKKDDYNINMYITTDVSNMTVYYDNPAMAAKISASDIKVKEEKEAEKKAQEEAEKRKRMDSLGL